MAGSNSLQLLIAAWKEYLATAGDWQQLVSGKSPKQTGCGPVYELENPIERPGESFVIADMRDLARTEPHYHPEETEVYIVLEGTGVIVVGGIEEPLEPGFVIVTPPNTAHFTVPGQGLVVAAINTPPFQLKNYVPLAESNDDVGFDMRQYEAYINH